MQRYRLEGIQGELMLKLGIPTENEAFNKTISKLQRVWAFDCSLVAYGANRRRQDPAGATFV